MKDAGAASGSADRPDLGAFVAEDADHSPPVEADPAEADLAQGAVPRHVGDGGRRRTEEELEPPRYADAAADLGKWDRRALECGIGQPRVVRRL